MLFWPRPGFPTSIIEGEYEFDATKSFGCQEGGFYGVLVSCFVERHIQSKSIQTGVLCQLKICLPVGDFPMFDITNLEEFQRVEPSQFLLQHTMK